jgi:hypothetical protein
VTLGIELAIEIGGAGDEAVIGRTAQHSFRNGGGALARKVAANDGSTAAVPDEHDLFPALNRVKARDVDGERCRRLAKSGSARGAGPVVGAGARAHGNGVFKLERG